MDLDFEDEDENPDSTDLASVPQGGKYTVTGTLYDTVNEDSNVQVGGREITFDPAGAGPLPAVTTQGLQFDGDVEIVACENSDSESGCSEDLPELFGPDPGDDGANNVVHLGIGGQIIFAPNTLDASIYLQDIGTNTIEFDVYDAGGLDHHGQVSGAGGGADVIPILQTHAGTTLVAGKKVPSPITKIEITQVLDGANPVPDGTIGIAAIVTHVIDGQDPYTKQYVTGFESESAGEKSSPFEVEQGRFFSTALETAAVGQNYPVQASFDGDDLYESSDSSLGEIDVISARGGITSASAGSVTTSPTADAGNDFVTYSCAAGNDIDGDALCDNWEVSGIVDVGGAGFVLPENDAGLGAKDIYVEVDAMQGFALTTQELNDIKAVFTNGPFAPNGLPYVLHIDTSAGASDAIPMSWPTHIWTDTSSATLGGTQINTQNSISATSKEIKVSGLSLTTTGAVTGGTITIKQKITLSASKTVTVGKPVVDLADGSAALTIGAFANGSVSPGSTANTVHTITYTIPFSTTGAITNIDLGRIKIPITIGSGGATVNTIGNTLGSPLITSNDDFDGIKKNFFGTQQERLDAGGTLGQRKANLVAKTYVYHYALVARNLGPNQSTCGSSGWAEDNGNDFVIALGSKRVNGVDQACFTGLTGATLEREGTFLHELGHNLGLKHNGYSDDNCAPNYPSVMSYTRQVPITGFGTFRLDYSRQNLPDLDERTAGLGINEATPFQITTGQYPSGASLSIVYGDGSGVAKTATVTSSSGAINWNGGTAGQLLKPFDINFFSTIVGCNIASSYSNLQGYDDWDHLDLNFRDGNPIDGAQYPLAIMDEVDNDVYKSLLITGNQGQFSGLIDPIKQITIDQISSATTVKQRTALPLQFTYKDAAGTPITSADLKVQIFKIENGHTVGSPIAVKPNPPGQGINFKYVATKGIWQYVLSTDNLQVGSSYGVEVWRDGIGTGTKLDNNTDGFAGFFKVVQK